MTTICGHERSELLCVLHWSIRDDERNRTKERCECGGACCTIYNNLIDPAKLAEMLAHEGRRLGFDDMVVLPGLSAPPNYPKAVIWLHCELIAIEIGTFHSGPRRMSEARAILLAWLQLPDGAHDEAEKVLRGDK